MNVIISPSSSDTHYMHCIKCLKQRGLCLAVIIAITAIAAETSLASCSWGGDSDATDETELVMPKWPPYGEEGYPPLAYYQVRIIKADGDKTFQVTNGGHIMVINGKDNITSIIAQPVTKHNGALAAFFRPAGCILPSVPKISWEGGFAAVVCSDTFDISTVSNDAINKLLSKFNWPRFISEVALRSTDTKSLAAEGLAVVCDPWTLDSNRVAKDILYNKFTAATITPTAASDNRTVQDVKYLLSLDSALEKGGPLLPRYVEAYPQQKANGKIRLISERYALEKNLTGANIFLCGNNLASFTVSIKGTGSKAQAAVKVKVLAASADAFLRYGLVP